MFYDQLKYLCESHNMTVTTFLKEKLNLSTGKGTAWKNGSIPKYEILYQISEYFDVHISYLFQDNPNYIDKHNEYVVKATQTNKGGGDNVINSLPAKSIEELDQHDRELLGEYHKLSLKNKAKVITYMTELEDTAEE